jgi:uncharacterized spore protein YtfJ
MSVTVRKTISLVNTPVTVIDVPKESTKDVILLINGMQYNVAHLLEICNNVVKKIHIKSEKNKQQYEKRKANAKAQSVTESTIVHSVTESINP